MNKKPRGTVPITRHSRKPTILDHQHLMEVEQSLKQAQKGSFDQHHKVEELPTSLPENLVWLPDRQGEGRIKEQVNPTSCEVRYNEIQEI